ncbi:mRNA-decapping enzyme 1B-like [Acanthaster planci]|uniref:5'-(N(7)-methylguanosine 5'-triphospho)-[mRNA] hydrolase n=1 Tax=Acanthaster planci TaxID=133434 RepID=A0A8B7XK95_ACAPL|nr:mRNA-decapping enzyme 1B-like [Acanthaster planci]
MAADSKAEDRMNLAALQQCDPHITNIVQTASQVALYTFNAEGNEWEKTDIEGSLFVYARSASPYNGFMIMNRLSMNNLTEPITKELEFQLQDPFLLYKTAQSIYGLWFYDKTECQQVARLMESFVHKAKKRAKGLTHRSRSVSESGAGPSSIGQPAEEVDIMQMLSRAQRDYKNQKGEADSDWKSNSPPNITAGSPTVVRPVPVKAEDGGPEQNAKQTGKPSTNKVVGQMSQGPATHPGFQRSTSMQADLGYLAANAAAGRQPSTSQGNDILQKLLAHPGGETGHPHRPDPPVSHRQIETVESLERRQSQKQALEGKTTDQALSQGSKVRTVESIEKQHVNVDSTDSTERAEGFPIQDLLAKLNIAQQNKLPGKLDATEHCTIITQPVSQGGLIELPELVPGDRLAPAAGHTSGVFRTSQEEVKGQSDSDISQKLLTNLTARAMMQTSPGTAPVHLIQPSAIRPNVPIRPAGSEGPLKLPGDQHVPSLQQLASGRRAQGPASTQTATNGVTTGVPTSPQRIPGSLHPPTLLTPQAFRKRSASETVQVAHPSPLFPSTADGVAVRPRLSASQHSQGPSGVQAVSASRHSPLLNKVDMDGWVNTTGALNREQFKQAFVHLLQNDSHFLSSLHSAYLESFELTGGPPRP